MGSCHVAVSRCPDCRNVAWPPSRFCSRCLQETAQEEMPLDGTILEYSKQDGRYFCIAEINCSFRILGRIVSGTPRIGSKIMVENYWNEKGIDYFEMAIKPD